MVTTASESTGGSPGEIERRVLEELWRNGVTTATGLSKALKSTKRGAKVALASALERLVAERRAFAMKDGKTLRYVHRDPDGFADEVVLEFLGRKPAPQKDITPHLKQRVPGYRVQVVLDRLLRSRRIHAVFKLGKTGSPTKAVEKYALGPPPPPPPLPPPPPPPPPAAFLNQAKKALEIAFKRADAHGVSRAALVAALLESVGVATNGIAVAESSPEDDEEALLAKLNDVAARERSGALIPLRRLRAAAALAPARFDQAVLALARRDAVILHHHDFVGDLSEKERAELVQDEYGTYYVGIALKRGS